MSGTLLGAAHEQAPLARLRAMELERVQAGARFFEEHAQRLALLCHLLAERFAAGGRLLAVGHTPQERSDARHVAVEFVHPVIVGKRALPAIALGSEGDSTQAQVQLLAGREDILIAFGAGAAASACVASARERGCLTIAFAAVGAEWEFPPPTRDAEVAQELVETLYHVLWELVHVFFEQPGLLSGPARPARGAGHDAGAASFLYPFLAGSESGLDAVVQDVRSSALAKAREIGALRTRTLRENRDALLGAARALRACFEGGGTLLALGNGGSATDAMDAVADFRGGGRLAARAAIDLTEDPAILTAIANDVGPEAMFSRQVIAHGRRGDALLALSTSGGSANVLAALAEGRRRGLRTVAMVGYDGGRIAAEGLADHVVVVRSEHIPRIQEAQASACHALRELVELVDA